jgi:hypothetical protein
MAATMKIKNINVGCKSIAAKHYQNAFGRSKRRESAVCTPKTAKNAI